MDKLTETEKDMLLMILKQHMSMETRQQIMMQLPMAYNKLVGKRVVAVVQAKEGADSVDTEIRKGNLYTLG